MAIKKYSCEELEAMVAYLAFPEYLKLKESREVVDDCLAGQNTIKEKKKYLPPNDWQKTHEDQYRAFLRRALFPGETKYALDIYEGLFSLGTPTVSLPASGKLDFIINNASAYGDSLKDVQMRLNSEQMSHGLRCMLLEVKSDIDKPFFIREYSANKFLRSHFTDIDGESVADFVLVDESASIYDLNTFSDIVRYQLRILALDANGVYYQRAITPDELNSNLDVKNPPDDERTIYPAVHGKRFNRIPFVWCGASSISGARFDYPPMKSMADTELALYVAMANHSQHIYMNTQEILFFTGVSADAIPKDAVFGCGSYLALKNPDAKAQYISTNGIGFTAEKDEITQLKSDIEQKRLSLMNAKSHQSGTVVGLVQNSQSAPLRTIVKTSGTAITRILKYMGEWLDEKDIDKISYSPSEQFAESRISISEFIALCKAVIAGEVKMLEEDLFRMARENGFIGNTMSWEEFKKRYKVEANERRKQNSILPDTTGNPFAAGKNDNR